MPLAVMRVTGWCCLPLGVGCLVACGLFAASALQQRAEISAFDHARACQEPTPRGLDCLLAVHGSVAGVTQLPGDIGTRLPAEWALDVRTATTTLHLTFGSDSPMLSYALDGDPAIVTMWRGIPVSVTTDGRADVTASVPRTAFGSDLRNSGKTAFLGLLLLFVAWASRQNRTANDTPRLTSSSLVAPSLLAPNAPMPPKAPIIRAVTTQLRPRRHPVRWVRARVARAEPLILGLLAVAVLFGVLLNIQDGPPARAFRAAPACVGETNLATCVGDFTAVINGVVSGTNGASGAELSYVTPDGMINGWAGFPGDAATIVRQASADEKARTQLRIRVWRRSIIGGEFGGRWHWASGDPPTNTDPAVYLAVSFAMFLLVERLRIRRLAGSAADRQELRTGDLFQVAAAAGAIALLAYGFWAGAILAVALLAWLGLQEWQSKRRPPVTLSGVRSA